jgi:hypothetical protein
METKKANERRIRPSHAYQTRSVHICSFDSSVYRGLKVISVAT